MKFGICRELEEVTVAICTRFYDGFRPKLHFENLYCRTGLRLGFGVGFGNVLDGGKLFKVTFRIISYKNAVDQFFLKLDALRFIFWKNLFISRIFHQSVQKTCTIESYIEEYPQRPQSVPQGTLSIKCTPGSLNKMCPRALQGSTKFFQCLRSVTHSAKSIPPNL
jgi:hypothetical protein